MHSLGQDVRYGARLLAKAPSFAAISVAALALGIGATTAIFSVVDAVLLKPLPFRDAGRLLAIYEKIPAANRFRLFVAPGICGHGKARTTRWKAWRPCSRGFTPI